MSRESRIRGLVKVVLETHRKWGSPNRLNATERRFLRKHPDLVRAVFAGKRSHVRAAEIVRKMRAYRLGAEDVDAVCAWLTDKKHHAN